MGTDVYLSFCWPIFDIRYISPYFRLHTYASPKYLSEIFARWKINTASLYKFSLQVQIQVLRLYSKWSIVWGLKKNFFPPLSPHVKAVFFLIPCLPVLSTPLSYVCCVCMDRLMANFAGTCTSDNKGLLLLCQSCTHCLRNIRTS